MTQGIAVRFLYSFLLMLAAPFLLFGLYKTKEGKPSVGKRWVEHFGSTPLLNKPSPLWIHAVSVGEVIAAKPVIFAIQQQYPSLPILVTTTTATGAAMAEKIAGVEHRYMPIDFAITVKRFLTRVQPRALLIMETELWPNTLAAVKAFGCPIVVLNARLSERSKHRYQKVQPLFNWIAAHLDLVLCQFKDDADRFKALGIAAEKVKVTGSVKFDLPDFDGANEAVTSLLQQMGERQTWIAASTHAGEDDILLRAHQKLLASHPDAILLLVPRHPERFNQVAERVEGKGLPLCKKK